ncbi:MAG: GAF domain-containing protein [Candidatus Promineifilaceae bacterium]
MRRSADLQMTEIQHQDSSKNAVRVIQLIILAVLIVNALEFYLAITLDAWQMFGVAWTQVGFDIFAIGGWWLARKGRSVWGLWVVFAAMIVVCIVATAFFMANTGLILALSVLLLIPMMAAQTMASRDQITRAILFALVGAMLILVAELYGAANRLIVPALETVLPIATVITSIIFAIIIFRQFPHFPIRTKFIASAVTLVALTVFALTFIISRNTQNTLVNAAGQRLGDIAYTHGLVVGELLARQVNSLQALSLNRAVQTDIIAANDSYSGDEIEIQRELDELEAAWQTAEPTDALAQSHLNNSMADELLAFQGRFPSNSNILATDKYGGLVGATEKVGRYSYAESPWWQTAYNNGRGSTFIGTLELDQSSNLFEIVIAIPIHATDSQVVIGVLQTTYSLRELTDILLQAKQTFGVSTNVDLLLPPNRLVDLTKTEPEGTLAVNELALLERNRSELYGQFEFENALNLVSQNSVSTLSHVPEVDSLGWVVVVHELATESLTPVRNQQRAFIVSGIVVLLIASLGAALFGQNLARPILNLTEAAVQVSEGDLTMQARVETEDELGTLAKAFNVMTARLRQTIALQEQRISERTHALEVSAEVSRRLSTILDEQELVEEMVTQVQGAFNYYHAHIYLFDAAGENLVMVGGTGEAGQKMLEAGHKITRGKGLVGRAAETKSAVLVEDVTTNPQWLPNPLLPNTVAEIAVPIVVGNDVLGVLDVQHNARFILKQEDADLLQSIANQVAIALQNARAYRRAQHQAQREALINEIGQKIQSTTTVDMALKTAVRELGQALSAGQTVVKLKNGTTNGHQSGNGNGSSE